MQTLESLVSALVESLRKSGLSIVEGMTGEYWITDTNKILDASPAKHSDLAMRVLAPMGSKLRDFLKQLHGKETDTDFSSLPADELEKHKDFIEYVKKTGFHRAHTPIEYAIQEMNWIRVYGNTFDVFSLTDENAKRISDFVLSQYKVDPEGEDANQEIIVRTDSGMFSTRVGELLGDLAEPPSASSFRKYTYGMAEKELTERIKKIGPNKWRVYSKKGKNLGTSSSLKAAKKRLKDVEFFKRKGQ